MQFQQKDFASSAKKWNSKLKLQNFSFKHGSMEIFFELNKKILMIFFLQFQHRNFASSAKKWNCKQRLQNYCRIKEKILLIQVKLKKFCKSINDIFFLRNKTVFFTSNENFA